MTYSEYLEFAKSLAAKTRPFILEQIQKGFSIETKSDNTVVTEVDRATEKLLRQEIESRYPDHGIIGEEFGPHNETAEFQWILDPIDGTISFSHRIPLYGTIIALHHKGQPVVGLIDHPGIGECYYAAQGQGAFCNNQKIQITDLSTLDDLPNEIIATGDRQQFISSNTMAQYQLLLDQHPMTRTIPDCFGHTLTAKGSIAAMIDLRINPWDIAATQILIEEAGGKFHRLPETKSESGQTKHNIIIGKPKVVDWLCEIF